jgi:hypothetical protein
MLAHQAAQGDVTPLGLHPSPVGSEGFTLHRATCNDNMMIIMIMIMIMITIMIMMIIRFPAHGELGTCMRLDHQPI